MIQEKLDNIIKEYIRSQNDRKYLDIFKFLKGELQRGKNKIVEDNEAINIFVSIIRKQQDMIDNCNISEESIEEAKDVIRCIQLLIPNDIFNQLYIKRNILYSWIEGNIDFDDYKNKMQAMKDIKKQFPYVDGNLIKVVLEEDFL